MNGSSFADAVLCANGPVKSPVDLTLMPEHRRGHGGMYGGLNNGHIDVEQLRTVLASLPLPRFPDGRLVLAVDVSPWLRSDAPCSAERLFCHLYGRAKSASQFIRSIVHAPTSARRTPARCPPPVRPLAMPWPLLPLSHCGEAQPHDGSCGKASAAGTRWPGRRRGLQLAL